MTPNFSSVVPASTAPPPAARAQHVAVLGAVAGDVVLAGLGAALGHLARQQRIVARQQRAHAAALLAACAPAIGDQAQQLLRRRGRESRSRAAARCAARARAAGPPRRRCPPRCRIPPGGRRCWPRPAACVEQRAQVAGLLQQRGGLRVAGEQRSRSRSVVRGQLAERLVGQRLLAHALAQRPGEAGGAHRADQVGHRVHHRRARHGSGAGVRRRATTTAPGAAASRRRWRASQCASSGLNSSGEQLGQVARVRRGGQHAHAQRGPRSRCPAPCAGRSRSRRTAPRDADVAPEARRTAPSTCLRCSGLLVQHVQQVAQAQHRRRRGAAAARRAASGAWRSHSIRRASHRWRSARRGLRR